MKCPIARWFGLASALGAFTCSSSVLAADNLIPNGNLEQTTEMSADGLPKHMTYWSDIKDHPVAKHYLSQEEKISGRNSLCIERLNDPKGASRISVVNSITVNPGQRYYFSCKIKSTLGCPKVLLFVRNLEKIELPLGFEDAVTTTPGALITHDGGMIQLQQNMAENPKGFNKVDLTFTLPQKACSLNIVIEYSHCVLGKAWFDDFELFSLE